MLHIIILLCWLVEGYKKHSWLSYLGLKGWTHVLSSLPTPGKLWREIKISHHHHIWPDEAIHPCKLHNLLQWSLLVNKWTDTAHTHMHGKGTMFVLRKFQGRGFVGGHTCQRRWWKSWVWGLSIQGMMVQYSPGRDWSSDTVYTGIYGNRER